MDTNTEKQEYTITVYTENQVGLLNRIAIIFSRRKINVESLNTSPSEIAGIHRFTIVVMESRDVVMKIVRQIEKQVEVLKAYFNTNDEIVWQELALYKVLSEEITEKVKVERLLREYGARAVAIRKDFIVFETTGHREETNKLMKAFISLLVSSLWPVVSKTIKSFLMATARAPYSLNNLSTFTFSVISSDNTL